MKHEYKNTPWHLDYIKSLSEVCIRDNFGNKVTDWNKNKHEYSLSQLVDAANIGEELHASYAVFSQYMSGAEYEIKEDHDDFDFMGELGKL